MKIKMLVEICGRCGNEVVNDNRNRGNEWLHLEEPEDGHEAYFGKYIDRDLIASLFVKPPEEDIEPAYPPVPAPEIPARDATDEEIGTNARLGRRQLIKHAKAHGFTVVARFARGPWLDQYGRPKRIVDCLAIAGLHEDGRRFYCWWVTKADGEYEFQSAFLAGTTGMTGSTDALDYVKGKTSFALS